MSQRFLKVAMLFGAATSAFAFNPSTEGWYGETTLQTTTSFANFSAPSPDESALEPEGLLQSPFLGLELRQSVSYRGYATLQLIAGGAHSLGAGTAFGDVGEPVDWYSIKNRTLDLSGRLSSSIAIVDDKSVFLEPSVGYEYFQINTRSNVSDFYSGTWFRYRYRGPSIGLGMRFFPTEKLGFSFGTRYTIARLNAKPYDIADHGNIYNTYKIKAARGALSGNFDLEYAIRSWVGLRFGLEMQSWSARQSQLEADEGYTFHSNNIFLTTRTTMRWGADFRY